MLSAMNELNVSGGWLMNPPLLSTALHADRSSILANASLRSDRAGGV